MIANGPTTTMHWVPPSPRHLRLYDSDESSRIARCFVKHHFQEIGRPDLLDDALIVASELVTNALDVAWRCWVYLTLSQGGIVIGVWDPMPDPPKAPTQHVPDGPDDPDVAEMSESGRGMAVVTALSQAWGWHRAVPNGKVVWALLGTPFPADGE